MTSDELAELLRDDAIEETVEWRHRETYPLDENGQGDASVGAVEHAGSITKRGGIGQLFFGGSVDR